jgi:hypothetical protein
MAEKPYEARARPYDAPEGLWVVWFEHKIVATCTERPQAQWVASMLNLLVRYKQALEGLTPGGSEFCEDPERCAAYIRGKLGGMASALKRRAIESRESQPKTEVPE